MIKPSRGPDSPGTQEETGGGDAATKRERMGHLAEGRARAAAVTCEDCFFRRRGLCALGLDSPCPTFRPDTPEGLVPPRQPALLIRDTPGAGAQVAVQAA